MNKTPETDKIIRNAKIADHPPTRLAATLTVKCEKLERERDEAREAFIEARKHREQLNSLLQSYEACWDEIKTTLGEPEEGDQTCDLDRVLKAIRERNEAREALMKIEEIFIDGGDTYLDFVRVGNIATDYLEGL